MKACFFKDVGVPLPDHFLQMAVPPFDVIVSSYRNILENVSRGEMVISHHPCLFIVGNEFLHPGK